MSLLSKISNQIKGLPRAPQPAIPARGVGYFHRYDSGHRNFSSACLFLELSYVVSAFLVRKPY